LKNLINEFYLFKKCIFILNLRSFEFNFLKEVASNTIVKSIKKPTPERIEITITLDIIRNEK
jgi:hypothetical protein